VLAILLEQILATSFWEAMAVFLGLAYLLLAIREKGLCWHAAFWSTAISTWLFWDASLLMESALQIYYLAMAVYGWYQWRYGGIEHQPLEISHWSLKRHFSSILLILVLSGISGYFLETYTSAAWPYLDSFTTWGAVFTTYLVARKILENWIYWLVIDAISAYLYFDRGLALYAALFILYLLMVIAGYYRWRKQWLDQDDSTYQPAPSA